MSNDHGPPLFFRLCVPPFIYHIVRCFPHLSMRPGIFSIWSFPFQIGFNPSSPSRLSCDQTFSGGARALRIGPNRLAPFVFFILHLDGGLTSGGVTSYWQSSLGLRSVFFWRSCSFSGWMFPFSRTVLFFVASHLIMSAYCV